MPVMVTAGFGVTVTVKVQLAVLPQGSVAVPVTVVSPSGKVVPGGGLKVTGTGPKHWSNAVPEKLTISQAIAVLLPGQVSTGGLVSVTCTVWTNVASLPQASFAVHVRSKWKEQAAVSPAGGGTLLIPFGASRITRPSANVTITPGSQLS